MKDSPLFWSDVHNLADDAGYGAPSDGGPGGGE